MAPAIAPKPGAVRSSNGFGLDGAAASPARTASNMGRVVREVRPAVVVNVSIAMRHRSPGIAYCISFVADGRRLQLGLPRARPSRRPPSPPPSSVARYDRPPSVSLRLESPSRPRRGLAGVASNARLPVWTTTFMFSTKPSSQCSGSIARNVMAGLSACARSAGGAFGPLRFGRARETSIHPGGGVNVNAPGPALAIRAGEQQQSLRSPARPGGPRALSHARAAYQEKFRLPDPAPAATSPRGRPRRATGRARCLRRPGGSGRSRSSARCRRARRRG